MNTEILNNTQNIHPLIQKILDKRGYSSAQDIKDFFSEDLKALPNFSDIPGLLEASQIISQAIIEKKKIAIYGDYDVDGTTSCALFYHFFQMISHDVGLYQPSRFEEGYGLHCSSIDQAISDQVELLITVDCGITNADAAEYALDRGLDLIITDHHKDLLPELPKALAVVNPNRREAKENDPLKCLAGVAVAFATCVAVRTQLISSGKEVPSLYPLLQFVAVGTICDLVPLNTMNLKLVRHGLKQLPKTNYPGLKSFLTLDERKLSFIPSEKLSFQIGPMINSKGRVDHPEKALNLLTASDSDIAFENYSHLEISNNERKQIQNTVYQEAKEMVLKSIGSHHLINIVYQPHWHEGVIGIVASKLVEQFKVPTLVFTNSSDEGIIKASARTAGELSIFSCLEACQDLFLKFGGHKAAAGLSMKQENFQELKARLTAMLQDIPEIERTEQDSYDLEINGDEINAQLAKQLEKLEPFGQGNPVPTFKIRNLKIGSYQLLKDIHVRWNFLNSSGKAIKGISFNYIGSFNKAHPEELFQQNKDFEQPITVYGKVGINRFKGNEYLQLQVLKVVTNDL